MYRFNFIHTSELSSEHLNEDEELEDLRKHVY